MKIVICGAGLVGSAIASHLSEEQNDVTVIDASAENIQRITDHYDVHGVVGVASHPDRLAEAGVRDAELLIAVTESPPTMIGVFFFLQHKSTFFFTSLSQSPAEKYLLAETTPYK